MAYAVVFLMLYDDAPQPSSVFADPLEKLLAEVAKE
jgi:hypothetical protein